MLLSSLIPKNRSLEHVLNVRIFRTPNLKFAANLSLLLTADLGVYRGFDPY